MEQDKSVVISYETLFEILRIERTRTELQELPDSYIEDISKLLAGLTAGLAEDPEKRKKQNHINNITKIINEIYERREKKITNMALDKSKTSSALIDFSKFLKHEKALFNELLDTLNKHRENMQILRKKISIKKDLPKQAKQPEQKETLKKETYKAVRFLSPMPRFLGPQLEEYGPFDEEDIASLPPVIVDILTKKKRAEPINI